MEKKKFLKIPNRVIIRPVGNDAVLLNPDTKQYYSLNQTGARMLQLLTECVNLDQAVERMAGEYDAPVGEIRQDMTALISNLQEQGLIEPA